MSSESGVFLGVSAFFGICAAGYGWWSLEPAGTAALIVSCLMAALVSVFLANQRRSTGVPAQNRKEAEVRDTTGPVAFFPPRSAFPVLAAAGTALTALGVVYGLWLFLIGLGVLVPGVWGFVFQYGQRGTGNGT
ncbi:cytochrome c oxidase subunit 4 [Streptomyces sp. NPDC059785]|uniref:aa3-type cytochrome oxidase subunit IV n=1 Tax=Streptomyces sp. NPDC059785 TaxID=3346945 RepID=UPI0036609A5D